MSTPSHTETWARPEIEPNPYILVPHKKRLTVVQAFYDQYLRIFDHYLSTYSERVRAMALEDELQLTKQFKSNEQDYTRTASNQLTRLKRTTKIPLGVFLHFEPLVYREMTSLIHSDEILIQRGYPTCDKTHASFQNQVPVCVRCQGDLSSSTCLFHSGTLTSNLYSCCGRSNEGCCSGPHVFQLHSIAQLHHQFPYAISKEGLGSPPVPPLFPILALNCEVCYTTNGVELARVCVLDSTGEKLLDELVRPEGKLLDSNTSINGIDQASYTLTSIREKILNWINDDTIIIGHALQEDFNALRLIHPTVVDTSILFQSDSTQDHPTTYTLQELNALYLLKPASKVNQKDCYENAKSCLQLVRYHLKNQTS